MRVGWNGFGRVGLALVLLLSGASRLGAIEMDLDLDDELDAAMKRKEAAKKKAEEAAEAKVKRSQRSAEAEAEKRRKIAAAEKDGGAETGSQEAAEDESARCRPAWG